jgi:hypothetical protein
LSAARSRRTEFSENVYAVIREGDSFGQFSYGYIILNESVKWNGHYFNNVCIATM